MNLNTVKKISIVVLCAIIILLSIKMWYLGAQLNKYNDSYKEFMHQSDSIIAIRQQTIDSLEADRQKLIAKRDSLDNAIRIISNKYNQIKINYGQKKDSVATLNLNGLHGFFSGGGLSPDNTH